jgi:hypothetical protein
MHDFKRALHRWVARADVSDKGGFARLTQAFKALINSVFLTHEKIALSQQSGIAKPEIEVFLKGGSKKAGKTWLC